ncbi:hypothetical protein NBRC116494_15850 [Aurantivibrio plasticivorans]
MKTSIDSYCNSALRLALFGVLIIGVSSNTAYPHSGLDQNRELKNLSTQIKSHHAEFELTSDLNKKKKHLSQQVRGIRSTLLLLRNELSGTRAKNCIKKEGEVDYFKELGKALKATKKTLDQLDEVI